MLRVIAANRDEYLDRPTKRAHFWQSAQHVLAGIDVAAEHNYQSKILKSKSDSIPNLQPKCQIRSEFNLMNTNQMQNPNKIPLSGHGTWIGITKTGRFGFVTNIREHHSLIASGALSRGYLVRDYLLEPPERSTYFFISKLVEVKNMFNGFNFVAGKVGKETWYVGNRVQDEPCIPLSDGIVYGISNGNLAQENETWPKVARGKFLFANALKEV